MATQTGSIDLEATNAVKLAAEASVDNKLENYTTHSELSVEANRILGTVSETYSTESSVSSRFSTVNQKVNGLEITIGGKVDSDEPWVSWLHAGVDETTHEPYLAMGQDSDSPSVVYGNSAAKFYDGEGDAESNVVASFGANGAIIGNVESSHTSITSEVTAFHDANGKEAARISMSDQGVVTAWASYSVTPTTSWTDRTETGITPLPDFTLGDLELAVSVDDEMIRSYNISSFTQPQISFTYGDIDVKFQATKSGDTWTYHKLCQGIESMEFSANEQNQQYFFLCGNGFAHNEVTGAAPQITVSGRRILGNAAQDYNDQKAVQKMRLLESDVQGMMEETTDPAVKKALKDLAEAIHYSDVPSIPGLADVEGRIAQNIAVLQDELADENADPLDRIETLRRLLKERDWTAAILKR